MSAGAGSNRYGNYEVLAGSDDGEAQVLGGGPFSTTYKARHISSGELVALKVVTERYAQSHAARERFLNDARAISDLHHPNIAALVEFGESQGTLYCAVEFCKGDNLEDVVRKSGALDAATLLGFARQMASALGCAHAGGVIHRDVMPANIILLRSSGSTELKLVDFGLVKPMDEVTTNMASVTFEGQTFFNPLYASPEQVMDESLDARSDLFSLGMTLWFLLKGSAPESGASAVLIAKRVSNESYAPLLPPDLPPKLRQILARLLEKDRSARFATATELLAALDAPEESPAVQPLTVTNRGTQTAAPRLADRYQIEERSGRTSLGDTYRATRRNDGASVAVTVVDDALREDATRMERLRTFAGRWSQFSHEAVVRVDGLDQFEDAEVFVREWPHGVSLQQVMRSRGAIAFREALPIMRRLASAIDAAAAADLAGLRLAPDEVFVEPPDESDSAALVATVPTGWPPFRVRVAPTLVESDVAQDLSVTVSDSAAGSDRVEFGCLLYRMVAGMGVKFAARGNRSAYVSAVGLTEEGNRILSGVIADDDGGGVCNDLLLALMRTEGLGGGAAPAPAVISEPAPPSRAEPPPPAPPVPDPITEPRYETSVPEPAPASVVSPATVFPLATVVQPAVPAPVVSPPAPVPAAVVIPPVATVTPPEVVPAPTRPQPPAPPVVAPVAGNGFPLAAVVIALVIAAFVLGAVAAVFLHFAPIGSGKKPKPTPTVAPVSPTPSPATPSPASTPIPSPSPTATPVATPSATSVAAQLRFSLHYDRRLRQASFAFNGKPLKPTQRNSDGLVFEGITPPAGELVVTIPGYKEVRLTVADGASIRLPDTLPRATAPNYLMLGSKETDYAFVAFSFKSALPGEDVDATNPAMYSLRNVTSPARVELPTGVYTYKLLGPGQQGDATIAPLTGSVAVREDDRNELTIPASFAGRYRGEFDDLRNGGRVTRTLVLRPGLSEGRCDERYSATSKLGDISVDNVPLTEIRVDADGVLHAHLRYAAHRYEKVHNYDEIFALRHAPAGSVIMSDGRETMPADPVMRSELEQKLRAIPPSSRPRYGDTELKPTD